MCKLNIQIFKGFSTVNGLVPMRLAVLIQRGKHDRQDDRGIVADQGHNVLIVPVVQGTFCDLNIINWEHVLLKQLYRDKVGFIL